MLNVVISEELYDREFVNERVTGFEELKEAVKDYTPEWAEKISGVPAEDIRKVARLIATKRTALLVNEGLNQHTSTSTVSSSPSPSRTSSRLPAT